MLEDGVSVPLEGVAGRLAGVPAFPGGLLAPARVRTEVIGRRLVPDAQGGVGGAP